MIGLDTNILARYYVHDEDDGEAQKQQIAAKQLFESGQALKVSKTVMLELEWVLRGYYHFEPDEIVPVFRHLLGQSHIHIEAREEVEQAIEGLEDGLDFADALHHAHYQDCEAMASFDDRRFARRVKRLGLAPRVIIPK
ncbi:type II toxin-antitoxin system VapC family toxin [Thiothrix litoralis]|uniref:Type II toxin-antitoxin system VapC family toxin n=1 Tax=Thiothrix litoralis TaxID=2891210 RepID=A0ABX7WU51_9GAMM|nr:type II toxin-antitoxin system VapC family toxin [Thiothrix litoralis]QTR45918.1 type II toxin-antitoxin system VapC family toxin [Thiothrix litoralis]